MYERALDLVGQHCDLEQRLKDIPPSARARGVWVRPFEGALSPRRGAYERYLEICDGTASPMAWHPLGQIVTRVAVAAALIKTPSELQQTMREVSRAQAVQFSESLLGRVLLRLLSPDPKRALQQGAAARRQGANYGRWDYDFDTPGRCVITHRDEYLWLDSQVLGSAEGTFDAIRVPATIRQRLVDAYNGVTEISW